MSLPRSGILFICKMVVWSLFQHASAAEHGFLVLKYCRGVSWLPASMWGTPAWLPAEPGQQGELEPAVGLPWLTAAKPAESSQDQSILKSSPARRSPLYTVVGRRGSRQGKSCATSSPEHGSQRNSQPTTQPCQPCKDRSSSQGSTNPLSSRFMRRRRCVRVLQADKPWYPPDS